MKVVLAAQVIEFDRKLPPEPRRRIRDALRALAEGEGDIRALEPPLDGYCRLRVGGYRIVFAYGNKGYVQCIYIERRSLVYEVLAEQLRTRLGDG